MLKEVDTRGLPCPQPVIKTKEALEEISPGENLKIVTDSEVSLENIKKFLQAQGHKLISLKKIDSDYHLLIERGSSMGLEPYSVVCPTSESQGNLLIIIASDHLGEDQELGKTLLKGFFESMLTQNLLPDRIFFMNTGVRLTTIEEAFIPILQEFVDRGVEIFSCGTCLKHFQLEDKLKVGLRGGTDTYLEALFKYSKSLYIS